MTNYPSHILKLVEVFKKFPGIGTKTAERLVFDLINWSKEQQGQLASLVHETKERLQTCEECGALIDEGACSFCDVKQRVADTLCVVAFAKDLFLIDSTRQYRGLYHVLGGMISPIHQLSLSDAALAHLKARIARLDVKEVILALDSTLEGDATALYIKKTLEALHLPISRLAFGLPMGSSLDFIDGGTLCRALEGRLAF